MSNLVTKNSEIATGGRHAPGARGVAATAHPSATAAAAEVLRAGGNAVDAAVAAAWALSVCEPSGSGLGGQTTMLVHFADGSRTVIDGHSYAPAAVSLDSVNEYQQRVGHRACTIPSTPATLDLAHRRWGLLPRRQVVTPAIKLAEEGYPVSELQSRQAKWVLPKIRLSPGANRLFLKRGRPYAPGELFRQAELAETLHALAERGADDFYRGELARAVAEDMRLGGGLLTERDLEEFTLPAEREPLQVDYRAHLVLSVPPPGGGLQLLLALKVLEQLSKERRGGTDASWYEQVALSVLAVFRERQRMPPAVEELTPRHCNLLLSEERARLVAEAARDELEGGGGEVFDVAAAASSYPRRPRSCAAAGDGAGETTHLCVADGFGNVVSLTQSIQSLFGAKAANGRLGFLYNNYLRTCPRYAHPNRLGPGCTPRSNVAPTLVLKRGPRGWKPLLALGAAGSRRITSSVLQVLCGVIDRGMTLEAAVGAPRVHALLSRAAWVEAPAAEEALLEALSRRFRKIKVRPRHSYKMGAVQAVQFTEGGMIGAADPRRDGTAAGLL